MRSEGLAKLTAARDGFVDMRFDASERIWWRWAAESCGLATPATAEASMGKQKANTSEIAVRCD